MRKTCKCGNVMSDSTVPNKVVYWTYLEDEWEKQKLDILGKAHYPFIRTVWRCDRCDRLYNWEPKDNKLYIYFIEKDTAGTVFSCCTDLKHETLIKVYSYNDLELPSIHSAVKNLKEPLFPREIYFCPSSKRIYVKKNESVKVFSVEEVVDL
ncbi:MAG TPA: hypothetical protein VF941_03390 [Clostridia bacterium]